MSKANCPLCGAELELPDGLPRHLVCCPSCRGQFKSDEAVAQSEPGARQPDPAGAFHMDTRAITQPMPAASPDPEPPPTSITPDPLGAYRGDTLAISRPGPTPSPPPPPSPMPSSAEQADRFGAFDLLEELGSSDVAVTYRARWRAQGDIVTLKVLAPGKTATSEEVDALVERARAASKLRSDGVVHIIEVRKRDDADYIASDFIEGRPLADMLDAAGPDGGAAVEVARSLAWILDRAHCAGVVHGNLKPSNVILDAMGEPHVTDFGLARELWRLSPKDLRSTSKSAVALPLYTSPEQVGGEEPTAQSDVYSIGALLYHMLTGRPPFEGRDILEVVLAVNGGGPVPPVSINHGVPPAVNAIVMKCLERKPCHRFATAEELAGDLERFLHGRKIRATVPGAGGRIVRAFALRWKAVVAVAALAGAAAVGAWSAGRSMVLPEWLAVVGGSEQRAEAALHAADDLVRGGRLDEAEAKVAPIESNERLPAWLRSGAVARLGVIHFQRGEYGRAAERFSRAIGIRPGGDAANHYLYGVALWHAGGDPSKVTAALREAIRLDPAREASAACQYHYGRACERAKEHAEARLAFERVKQLDPAYKPELVASHLAKLGR